MLDTLQHSVLATSDDRDMIEQIADVLLPKPPDDGEPPPNGGKMPVDDGEPPPNGDEMPVDDGE